MFYWWCISRLGEWLELENKAPHWNENLKCWCLNFRGRVKFASVKNFQLVDAANPDAIVMQVNIALSIATPPCSMQPCKGIELVRRKLCDSRSKLWSWLKINGRF